MSFISSRRRRVLARRFVGFFAPGVLQHGAGGSAFAKRCGASMLITALALASVSCVGGGVVSSPRRETGEVAVRRAPAPLERYEISAVFEGLPAAVDSFTGVARFSVSNPECAPLDAGRAYGGVRLAPRHELVLEWRSIGDGAYRANADLDALRDENYFGLGVCRWRFDGVDVRFSVRDAQFVHGIAAQEVRGSRLRRGYYLVRDLAQERPERAIFGEAEDFYRADLGAQFVLMLDARRDVVAP